MWRLSDHACRHCHGRLLASVDTGAFGPALYRCAQCGCHVDGSELGVHALCSCGLLVGKKRVLQCIVLPEPRPLGWPEIGVRTLDKVSVPAARMPRYVGGE